jgi:hypothetical protein
VLARSREACTLSGSAHRALSKIKQRRSRQRQCDGMPRRAARRETLMPFDTGALALAIAPPQPAQAESLRNPHCMPALK